MLTANEIAKIKNVKSVTVRSWLAKGFFPNAVLDEVSPFGKIWRVPESDVLAFEPPKKTGRPPKSAKSE